MSELSNIERISEEMFDNYHHIALNFLLSTFVLKEKLLSFNNIPLLSARDIKRWIVFKLYRNMSEDQMIERHCRWQEDINSAFERQEDNLLKWN